LFGIERRKHFRFELDLPASLALVGHEASGRLGARATELSQGGAQVCLAGLPHWSLRDAAGRQARFLLDLELGQGRTCRFEARPIRVMAMESGCRLALQFVASSERDQSMLQAFLGDYLGKVADDEVRASFARHQARRRRHTVVALTLAAVAALLLTWVAIQAAEAVPEMLSSMRRWGREEVQRTRREFIEEEWARVRRGGVDPDEYLRSLSPEDRARLRRYLEEHEPAPGADR
jgi:hypothetical protein